MYPLDLVTNSAVESFLKSEIQPRRQTDTQGYSIIHYHVTGPPSSSDLGIEAIGWRKYVRMLY